MSAALILGAMDLAIAAMKAYPHAQRAYNEWRTDLEEMRREGREPTLADLQKYTSQIDEARRKLHSDDD